jgi:drug/metabolite transporter (DMT)-like permease
MVFVISAAAAVFLGVGWVVQQRVAISSDSEGLLSWKVIVELISSWLWWLGIATMTIGQSLSAWALQFGPVSSVEPVLVGFLLVAFIVSAAAAHHRPRWQELTGPVILIIALTAFLAISDPQANRHSDPGWRGITVATVAAGLITAAVVVVAKVLDKRTPPVVASALFAAAAGVMYGLQDAATRGAIVVSDHHPLIYLVATMWPWVLLAAATAGVLLSQAAFRAERLDYALPPTAATQPIAGVIVGVTLLGDRLSASGVALAFEALCVVAMLAGVLLIGRSPAFES